MFILQKKCTKKIVGPIFLQIIVKVYDPVNVTGVFLTFFFVDFTTFLLTLIEEGSHLTKKNEVIYLEKLFVSKVRLLICHL